jgi:hypothetical protein
MPGRVVHCDPVSVMTMGMTSATHSPADDVMNQATFMHWGDYDHEHAGFTMHSVCYRTDFNPKVWRVDRVLRYYRYDASGEPACLTTQCERRERAAVNG